MNVRLYDGSVRCGKHMDAATHESLTNDRCAYCPSEEATGRSAIRLLSVEEVIAIDDTHDGGFDRYVMERTGRWPSTQSSLISSSTARALASHRISRHVETYGVPTYCSLGSHEAEIVGYYSNCDGRPVTVCEAHAHDDIKPIPAPMADGEPGEGGSGFAETPGKAKHTDAPSPVMVYARKRDRDRAARFLEMFPPRPQVARTPELSAGYHAYVSDGLADTDGYFTPLDFNSWARTSGANL